MSDLIMGFMLGVAISGTVFISFVLGKWRASREVKKDVEP